MTRVTLVVVLVSIVASALPSAGQTRDDFAFGFTVQPVGDNPIWEISLPDEVYERVTRSDLGDIRVFDRIGKVLPHVVGRPPALLAERPQPAAVPVFPVRGLRGDGAATSRLRVSTDARGRIIDLTTEGATRNTASPITAYVLDLSSLAQMPEALDLEWQGQGEEGFAERIDVRSSDDLAVWQEVTREVTLAELTSEGAMLRQNRIPLPTFRAKYLRIEWPEPLRRVRLSSVQASFPAPTQPLQRRTIRLQGTAATDARGTYDFDARGLRPVDHAQIMLGEGNAVLQGELQSKPSPEAPWNRRVGATFYRLTRGDTTIQSAPTQFRSTTDRYWRLVVADGAAWSGEPPTLELYWAPDVLTGVAQGEAPYTVAFGSGSVGAADTTASGLQVVIREQGNAQVVGTATMGPMVTLGGESRLLPPDPPLPWRTWVLWATLLAGVGLLGWMVAKLAAGMKPS